MRGPDFGPADRLTEQERNCPALKFIAERESRQQWEADEEAKKGGWLNHLVNTPKWCGP